MSDTEIVAQDKKAWYTVDEVAVMLKISSRTLRRYIELGMFQLLIDLNITGKRRNLRFTDECIALFVSQYSGLLPTGERDKRVYRRGVREQNRAHSIKPTPKLQVCVICGTENLYETCMPCQEKFRIEILRVRAQVVRARRAGVSATLTLSDWLKTLDAFGWRCAYCNGPFDLMEHYIPICSGGGTTAYNCLPACRACNLWKSDLNPEIESAW